MIVDYNKIQSLDSTENTLALEPLEDKAKAFGFNVKRVDGHNIEQLIDALDIKPKQTQNPSFILCDTTKGKGISFMENSVLWHYRSAQDNEYKDAKNELIISINNLEKQ